MAYSLKEEDLPPTSIPPGVTCFPDFVPEGEEDQYAGMGAGNRLMDFIPDEHTASDVLLAQERLADRHKQIEKDRERLETYKRSEAAKRGR